MDSETQTKERPAEKSGANISRMVRRWLAVTMALESLLVLVLTVWDFALAATTLTATIGSMTLLAISAVGFWATYATCKQHDSWLGASLLGQFSIAVLAGYTVLTAVRSRCPQISVAVIACPQISVAVIAGILGIGITAIVWIVYLLWHRSDRRTTTIAVIMFVQSVLVFVLAWCDFALAAGLTSMIFSVTLLAISVVNFWAAYATWVQDASWRAASLLGQFSIAMLAGYTVVTDIRSPLPQITVGVIIAGIAGIFAIFWVVYLLGHRSGRPLPKWTPTIVALIPALGLVQFWLQADYLPRTSMPLVDVTADLTPTGKNGGIVQLEAKVTFNNRGSVPVSVGGTVMRITAYPKGKGRLDAIPDAIQFGFQASSPYREESLPTDKHTLYANDLLSIADVMAPGQSTIYRKVVDFDSGKMRLARLDVDGIFMTSPNIDEVYTCPLPLLKTWYHLGWWGLTRILPYRIPPQMSADDTGFQDQIVQPIYEKVADGVFKKFFCRDIHFKPRNVIHDIVGDHPRFEVLAIFEDPTNQSNEYPALLLWLGENENYLLTSGQWQKVLSANPAITYKNIGAEYIPSEQSAPPGGGTPSTTPPPPTTPPR
jgi:hypothetical protein